MRLQAGSDHEATTVRWIFHQFVVGRKSYSEISRQLNRAKLDNPNGRPWNDGMICTILKRNYIGNIVYNRTSRRLGQKLVKIPEHLWIRSAEAISPIVDRGIFARAQKMMSERHIEIPEDQMLLRLRIALARKGKLSSNLIEKTAGLPCVTSYTKHFGSLRNAYALIGYKAPRDYDWLDIKHTWAEVLAKLK